MCTSASQLSNLWADEFFIHEENYIFNPVIVVNTQLQNIQKTIGDYKQVLSSQTQNFQQKIS